MLGGVALACYHVVGTACWLFVSEPSEFDFSLSDEVNKLGLLAARDHFLIRVSGFILEKPRELLEETVWETIEDRYCFEEAGQILLALVKSRQE